MAYVAAEADYSQPHGFAIACQQDEKVWDINKLLDKWDTDVPVPGGLYEADCVIIDPWAGITRELTPETVADLKWKWIEHVMKVDLSTPAGDAEGQTPRILRTAGHASFVPESIPSDEEIIAAICDPFEIPQNTDPKADEICDDGIDNDGDGAIDCDDSQCTENTVCNPCANDSGIYVWYVDNLPLKDVFVSSCESYYNEDALCGYSGGGLDCSIPAIKVLLGSGYGTNDDAINATCSTVSITYPCGSTWSCGWLGDIGGQQHVIDSLGGCQ